MAFNFSLRQAYLDFEALVRPKGYCGDEIAFNPQPSPSGEKGEENEKRTTNKTRQTGVN